MTTATPTSFTATETPDRPLERATHRSQEAMDVPYATIKMFTDFGCVARKPLAPEAVEEMVGFWGTIQQLVATKQFSVALAKRCVANTAKEARRLAGDAPHLSGFDVREAISMVRGQATSTAGFLCRPDWG